MSAAAVVSYLIIPQSPGQIIGGGCRHCELGRMAFPVARMAGIWPLASGGSCLECKAAQPDGRQAPSKETLVVFETLALGAGLMGDILRYGLFCSSAVFPFPSGCQFGVYRQSRLPQRLLDATSGPTMGRYRPPSSNAHRGHQGIERFQLSSQ